MGRVADAAEMLDLPECQLINKMDAEMSVDDSVLIFSCLHREGAHSCEFKALVVQVREGRGLEAGDGNAFDVYVRGGHSNGHGESTDESPESMDEEPIEGGESWATDESRFGSRVGWTGF